MTEAGGLNPGGRSLSGRPPRLVRRVVALTWHKLFEDRILGLAAEAGFWALVSLPSMLLAIFGALGYLRGVMGASALNHVRDDVLRAAGDVLTPGTVASDVQPILTEVLSRGHLEVVSIGFVISLWSGSTAMADYLNTITVAYGMRGLRGAVRSRLVALWLYVCAILVGIVLLPALALGPDLITRLLPGYVHDEVSITVHVLYWPLVVAGTVSLLAYLYKACLPVKVQWRHGLPGATFAMVMWIVFSFVVRAYLTSSFRQHSAYGSLAAPIAGLLFFYFTALAVLLGAEINSATDAVWPVPSTAGGRQRSQERADALGEGGGRGRRSRAFSGRAARRQPPAPGPAPGPADAGVGIEPPVGPWGTPPVESPVGTPLVAPPPPPPGMWAESGEPAAANSSPAGQEPSAGPPAAPQPPATPQPSGVATRRSRWRPRAAAIKVPSAEDTGPD